MSIFWYNSLIYETQYVPCFMRFKKEQQEDSEVKHILAIPDIAVMLPQKCVRYLFDHLLYFAIRNLFIDLCKKIGSFLKRIIVFIKFCKTTSFTHRRSHSLPVLVALRGLTLRLLDQKF
jgi:hypothetical protein